MEDNVYFLDKKITNKIIEKLKRICLIFIYYLLLVK